MLFNYLFQVLRAQIRVRSLNFEHLKCKGTQAAAASRPLCFKKVRREKLIFPTSLYLVLNFTFQSEKWNLFGKKSICFQA